MKSMMKRILAICLAAAMVSTLVMGAGATGSQSGIRVSAQRNDGSIVQIDSYSVLEDGWNDAMELAGDLDEMQEHGYRAVVVDLYSDWYADEGEFTEDYFNGPGFKNDTIYVPGEATVILNLNGHTIDRGLTEDLDDGEVIYVRPEANLTINGGANAQDSKVGTITGGFSNGGAGGIHIEGASVTLNNVNVSGNRITNDDGGGIAAYSGTKLTINGGSFTNNTHHDTTKSSYGGAIYLDNSSAAISGCTFTGNTAYHGGAIYVCYDSSLTMTDCTISENSATYSGGGIYIEDGDPDPQPDGFTYDPNCKVILENVKITGNWAGYWMGSQGFGSGGGICMNVSTCLVLKGQTIIRDNEDPNGVSDIERINQGSYALLDVTGLTEGSEVGLYSVDWGVVGLATPQTAGWLWSNAVEAAVWEDGGKLIVGDIDDAPIGTGSIFGDGSAGMILAMAAMAAAGGILVWRSRRQEV